MGTETLSIQLPGYDCYNDPNWTDEALKQCRHKGDGFRCMLCCNEAICKQFIYDEGHLVWENTLDRSRMYITSRESTPSPMSYRVSEYLRTYYGTAVGADNND